MNFKTTTLRPLKFIDGIPVEGTSKGNHMTIAVLLKQVPDTTAKISVNGGRVDENAVSKWSFSPYDEYALEAALQLKESTGGEIVAITAGPARCEKLLRDAAAVGADTLVHVSAENFNEFDSTQVQNLLAAAVQKSSASLIFCGKQAADTNAGSTGPGVAELIGASCVTLVTEVSSEGGGYTATRPSSSGHEKVAVSAPCVFAFDKGVSEMRRPNVRGIMMAKKKPIEEIDASDLGVDVSPRLEQLKVEEPPKRKAGIKVANVAELVQKLKNEAKVI